ncbi:MAG: P1 family peptidase [Candidatus Sumerlaeia bacterium]|nr:P1 family peptidase [Candidatus Sumerlaeia bacterium]
MTEPSQPASKPRSRARELGIHVGILPTGKWNAITDVEGVLVGHVTKMEGDSVRTGVTAVLPHGENLFQHKVPAAVYKANAFGKLAGSTQIEELGTLETPIVVTNTLSVGTGVDALVRYTLSQEGNQDVRSVNAVVGETNDSYLNDIRGLHLTTNDFLMAIREAKTGPVAEGSVGAGTGTSAFGWKGGIGTSSRVLPEEFGGYHVGVLVQSNYGGILTINGAPVGRELGQFPLSSYTTGEKVDGSCMVIVATDAPLSDRNLERLAKRAVLGIGQTGSYITNGSGDYVIAFSTAYTLEHEAELLDQPVALVSNGSMSQLFLAAKEATEEALYNSLFMATTVTGVEGHTREAIDLDKVKQITEKYGLHELQNRLPGVRIPDKTE